MCTLVCHFWMRTDIFQLIIFFYQQETAYELRISYWIQTCALPILTKSRLAAVCARSCQTLCSTSMSPARSGTLRAFSRSTSLSRLIASRLMPWDLTSEERRVGQAWVSTFRTSCAPSHYKNKDYNLPKDNTHIQIIET